MRYTDPEEAMMRDVARAVEAGDIRQAQEALRSGTQEIMNELTAWINGKSLFDAPFVAAALILAGQGMMSAFDPPERAAAQATLNLLGAVSVKIPYKEETP